jgi:hypothetical protein
MRYCIVQLTNNLTLTFESKTYEPKQFRFVYFVSEYSISFVIIIIRRRKQTVHRAAPAMPAPAKRAVDDHAMH